jgi:hypothetical protein
MSKLLLNGLSKILISLSQPTELIGCEGERPQRWEKEVER